MKAIATAVAFALAPTISSFSQNTVLKNNLLYDATGTFNLGVETRLTDHWTFELNAGYNPWTFSHDKKWKHLMVSPQVRYWFKRKERAATVDATPRTPYRSQDGETQDLPADLSQVSLDTPGRYFRGWFVGADLIYSHFNAGNVKFPFGLYKKVRDQRMQGNLYAAGLFFGHSWELNHRWNLSADLGLNVGYYDAKTYECGHCGTYKGKDDDVFLLPKMGVNIIYKFGQEPQKPVEPLVWKMPFKEYKKHVAFTPTPSVVAIKKGRAGQLEKDNPVLLHISDYKPYDSSRVLRKEKGALYVYFPLDKTELSRDFRDNGPTLDRIVTIVDEVLADTTSDVKIIQIVGLASIEGSEAHNQQLGAGRALALKNYIIAHSTATESLFDVANGGEAWSEFRDQVSDASFDGKDDILAIIDSSDDVAAKERKIRAHNGGKTYAYIKENILKDQRNSGYIRIYYDYVPDNNADIITEAIELNGQGQYQAAIEKLTPIAYDSRSLNTLGIAYFRLRDYDKALDCFKRGAQGGDEAARKNYDGLSRTIRENAEVDDYNEKAWEENVRNGYDTLKPQKAE